jgi:protein-S-isoprenylcysteine O-methyltransferase Ste14
MENRHMTKKQLAIAAISRMVGFFILMGLILFGIAGSLAYWQAWIYLLLLGGLTTLMGIYLIQNDPALFERRMRMRERETVQKKIIFSSFLYISFLFVLPALNFRFGWSTTPVWAVIMGDLIIMLGYWIFYRVMRENSFASRVIEVEQGQKVIDSGPYARVRHPMYVSVILIYAFTPLALGCWWMVLPALSIIPILVVRLRNEEQVLSRDLPGYGDYLAKVKYRLLPGVW